MEIDAKAFALAGAILWGVLMFIMTWSYLLFNGYGEAFMKSIISVYPGFSLTPFGSVIGLIWGFADGFILLFILAWLYNFLRS